MRRNGRTVTVVMAGAESFALAAPLAAELRAGQELDAGEIRRLLRRDGLEALYRRCTALIARRPRSREEIVRYLRARKADEADSLAVLSRLDETGLLDDREFARLWVDNRQAFRPRSMRALRAELRRMGVTDADARGALATVQEDGAAAAAARRKAGRLYAAAQAAPRPRFEFERKLTQFLASRGFNYDLSRDTARRIWQELADPGSRGDEP